MGGSSKQDTHQVSSNVINPMQMGQYQDNYAHAQGVANNLQPYTGQITAGFNPNQIQAQGLLSGIATDPKYQAVNQNAINQVQGIFGNIPTSNISPQAVNSNPITASTYNPSTYNANTYNSTSYNPSTITAPTPYDASLLAGKDLSPYESPYQNDVINASVAQNQYARQQQGVADNAAATAAHAFGGSRQGVQRAETTASYDRNDQQNLAALNAANFAQAQQGALSDIGAQNQAKQFNTNMAFNTNQANAGILNAASEFGANAANTAGQFNAGAQNTANQFNTGSLNTAGQFNAGQGQAAGIFNAGQNLNAQQFNSGQDLTAQQNNFANTLAAQGLRMNAAGQLEQMNQADLARAAQQGGILSAVGDAQQQQQQAELSNAYNAYMQGQQLTLTQQQLLNQALGIIPLEQTNTTDGTQTTKSNPGIGGILGGVASLGLAAATGGSSLGLTAGLGGLGGLFGGSLKGQSSGPSMGWQ